MAFCSELSAGEQLIQIASADKQKIMLADVDKGGIHSSRRLKGAVEVEDRRAPIEAINQGAHHGYEGLCQLTRF